MSSTTSAAENVEQPMASIREVFQKNYMDFAASLIDGFPELEAAIGAAIELSEEERWNRFQAEVLPGMADVQGRGKIPSIMLPGVVLPVGEWEKLSPNNRKAILEFMGLLCSCILFESPDAFSKDGASWSGASKWFESMMGNWKEKMAGFDFKGMADKFGKIFGIGEGGIPDLPKKFLKGHIAKLAEELMAEFKPEDFGLDPELMKECEANPAKAFDILMKVYMSNPGNLQTMIARVGNRLKAKFANGQLRPEQIVAEAEELMKTFQDNPEFTSLMENFKSTFGFEDMEMAQSVGREDKARLNLVKERLRKKAEAKKAAAASPSTKAAVSPEAVLAAQRMAEILMEQEELAKTKKSKGAGRK
jgi:hypothetical protein